MDAGHVCKRVVAPWRLRNGRSQGMRQGFFETVLLHQVPGGVGLRAEVIRVEPGQVRPFGQLPSAGRSLHFPGRQHQAIARCQRVAGFAGIEDVASRLVGMPLRHGDRRQPQMRSGEFPIQADRIGVLAVGLLESALCNRSGGQGVGAQRVEIGRGGLRQRHAVALDRRHCLPQSTAQVGRHLVNGSEHRIQALATGLAGEHGGQGMRVDHLDRELQPVVQFQHGRKQHRTGAVAQRHLRGRGPVQHRGPGIVAHQGQGLPHLHVTEHVDMTRLLQADPERLLQRFVQNGLAGEVAKVAHHHPVTLGEGDGRLRTRHVPGAHRNACQ